MAEVRQYLSSHQSTVLCIFLSCGTGVRVQDHPHAAGGDLQRDPGHRGHALRLPRARRRPGTTVATH